MTGSVDVEPADHGAGDVGLASALDHAEIGPGAFAEALDQTGFGQKPKVAGQARLRLAQNLRQVGDGEFGLGQQRQDAEPGRFAGGFQHRGEIGKRKCVGVHGLANLRSD